MGNSTKPSNGGGTLKINVLKLMEVERDVCLRRVIAEYNEDDETGKETWGKIFDTRGAKRVAGQHSKNLHEKQVHRDRKAKNYKIHDARHSPARAGRPIVSDLP